MKTPTAQKLTLRSATGKTLACFIATLSTVSQATSPMPPSIDRNFRMSCMIDLGIVQEDARGAQAEYQSLRGTLKLNKGSLNEENLAREIRWTRWDMNRGASVRARLSDLPGNPSIEELSFNGMGDGSGNIGYFGLTLASAFADSGIGVKTQVSSYKTADGLSDNADAEASQAHAQGKTRYTLQIACGLEN